MELPDKSNNYISTTSIIKDRFCSIIYEDFDDLEEPEINISEWRKLHTNMRNILSKFCKVIGTHQNRSSFL